MTVAELEDRMSVAEAQRWALYEAEEPFLATRVDLIGGIIASVLANVNRSKTTPAFEPMDFMPLMQRHHERVSVEEARARLRFPPPIDAEDATLQRMVAAYG